MPAAWIVGGALALGSAIFNQRNASKERKMWQQQQNFNNSLATRQQDHAEHVAHNAVQIRRADMEAAGLHPSLMAGGGGATTTAGHMPSGASQPPQNRMNVMEQALFLSTLKERAAQIKKVEEEAKNIRAQTLLTQGRNSREAMKLTYDSEYLGIARNRNAREAELHGHELQNIIYRNAVAKYGEQEAQIHVADSRVKAAMNWLQHQYMDKNKSHMPTADIMVNHIKDAISNPKLDHNLAVGLKLLLGILR